MGNEKDRRKAEEAYLEKEKGNVDSDLEKMNKDRRKAEEAYLESRDRKLEIERIKKEGFSSAEDLVLYVVDVVENVKYSEDVARMQNNPLVYSEAIGIRREMEKLLNLIFMDDTATELSDGTEENHREHNEGEEAYQ